MKKLTPLDDNVIVKIIPQDAQIGIIVIPDSAIAESSLAEVMIPNKISYKRDGSERPPFLNKGMHVRIPTGKTGTTVPEAPDGESWLAIPEDCIYYIVED